MMTVRELIVRLASLPDQQREVRFSDVDEREDAEELVVIGAIDHPDHVELLGEAPVKARARG